MSVRTFVLTIEDEANTLTEDEVKMILEGAADGGIDVPLTTIGVTVRVGPEILEYTVATLDRRMFVEGSQ